jgi:hypothetical protein
MEFEPCRAGSVLSVYFSGYRAAILICCVVAAFAESCNCGRRERYDASFVLMVVTAFAWFCEIIIEEDIVEECVEQHPVFERVP